ncbi:MAG: hypothetical protein FWD77_04355 [Betaproteobacteria bacterium]|nr:hypothetical protein [Betaproteobacteria bacterium]
MDFNSSPLFSSSDQSGSPARSGFARFWKSCLQVLSILGIFALFLPLNPEFPGTDIDPAWAAAMNQAVAQGLRIGEELLFSFGPYSAIFSRNYHPATDLPALLGSAWLALGYSILFSMLARGTPVWRRICALLALFAFGAASSPDSIFGSRDALFFSYPLLACLALAKTEYSERRQDAFLFFVALSGLGLLPLIKSSLLPASALSLAFCALFLGHAQQRRIGGAPGALAALLVAATALLVPLGALFLCWHLSGQEMGTLAAFARNTLPVISGYADAMSVPGREGEIPLYLIAAFALIFFAALVRLKSDPFASEKIFAPARKSGVWGAFSPEQKLVGAALLAFFFLAFKAGFVRHDFHALTAASALALGAAFILVLFPGRISPLLFLLALAAALTIRNDVAHAYSPGEPDFSFAESLPHAGAATLKPFREAAAGLHARFLEPGGLEARYAERLREIHAAQTLPALPGASDIYSFDQPALLASGNTWTPRPVFQSYSAYTPELAWMNETHLLGANAPDNIFFGVQPIDGRLPALEDGSSWPLIFTRYMPTDFADGRIVFRKNAAATDPLFSPLPGRSAALGETVPIPEALSGASSNPALFARIRIEPSLAGKAARLLFKNSPLFIEILLDDGSKRTYRFIPGMAEAGFILSPLLETAHDPFLLLTQPRGVLDAKKLRTMRIFAGENDFLWRKEYEIEFQLLELPRDGKKEDPENPAPKAASTD